MNALLEITTATPVWHTPAPLADDIFQTLRRSVVLDHCKWDSQVGDVSTLAQFPLVLRADVWRQLSRWAEQLTAESLAAEAELLRRPKLHRQLAVPRRIRRVLRQAEELGVTPAAARVMRFDFHLTTDGWRISEVNSDVPGGFTEASSFTTMMAEHYPDTQPTGNPAETWANALANAALPGRVIALLSAAGYMEDQQIMAYLAQQLQKRGCRAFFADPRQLRWRGGRAYLASAWYSGPLDVVVRFYQGEWLTSLPRRCGWSHLFCGGHTPVGNPGAALLVESKRFPLVWDSLTTPLPTWRALLPETRDPRDAPWSRDDEWLVKTAFSNTGDTVSVRTLMPHKEWRRTALDVWLHPGQWVAQRRFEPVALPTQAGLMYPCIGVFTINGRTAGAYARVSPQPVINYTATDIALLTLT